jgi:hypothetical protein
MATVRNYEVISDNNQFVGSVPVEITQRNNLLISIIIILWF